MFNNKNVWCGWWKYLVCISLPPTGAQQRHSSIWMHVCTTVLLVCDLNLWCIRRSRRVKGQMWYRAGKSSTLSVYGVLLGGNVFKVLLIKFLINFTSFSTFTESKSSQKCKNCDICTQFFKQNALNSEKNVFTRRVQCVHLFFNSRMVKQRSSEGAWS